MELIFNPTRKVNSMELGLTCDPIEFEVKTGLPLPLRRKMLAFDQADDVDAGLAIEIVGQVVVSYSQNGKAHPFDQQTAEATRAAINKQLAGAGDDFICALAGGLVVNHYNFFRESDRRPGGPDSGQPAVAEKPTD